MRYKFNNSIEMEFKGIHPMVFSGNLSENWRFWKQRFLTFLKATEMDKKPEATKCAQLLTFVGEEGIRIYNTFKFEENEVDKFEKLIEKFDDHFNLKRNLAFERYKLLKCKQKEGQTIENYIVEVKNLALSCELEILENSLVKDIITCGISSESLREKILLSEQIKTLEDLTKLCISSESTRQRNKVISNGQGDTAANVYAIQRKPAVRVSEESRSRPRQRCSRCNYEHESQQLCPAKGKICKLCNKFNHFSSVCKFSSNFASKSRNFQYKNKRNNAFNNQPKDQKFMKNSFQNNGRYFQNKKNVHFIDNNFCDTSSDSQDNFLFIDTVEVTNQVVLPLNQPTQINGISGTSGESVWSTTLNLEKGNMINFKLDTGAMVNVIPVNLLYKININPTKIVKTTVNLCSYTQDSLPILGKVDLECHYKKNTFLITFFIVDLENSVPILGLKTCIDLDLIKRVDNVDKTVCIKKFSEELNCLLKKNEFIFQGIGCLKKPYKIELKDGAIPKVHPIRKIPFALQAKLKNVLSGLEKQKIIKKVNESTEWVNPFVIVRKPNGDLRICLDPIEVNKWVKRHYFKIPTLEELTIKFSGAKYFTTLDATQGFLQVPLDKESTKITTFGTPWGRYCWLRMPYGLSSSPEVFQQYMTEIFGNMEGCSIYSDDIIIYADTPQKHNIILKKVLDTASSYNIKFNKSKCQFLVNKVKYMGHEISELGLQPDGSKVEAIKNMPRPENKTDLQRFLGCITYINKFIKNLSELTAPLRVLLKKDVLFVWDNNHQTAFEKIKEMVCDSHFLQFYDVNKLTTISVDASKKGMGAVLIQEGKPCAFASRSFTQAQENYSQIEKELVGVQFGIEKFSQFVYGKHFIVETDHRPLIHIIKKPLNDCPARLQRILIQLRKYDFELVFKPGKELILADTLSRAFENKIFDENLDLEIDAQVCLISMQLNATDERIEELKNNTKEDEELSLLMQYVKKEWPNYGEIPNNLKFYYKFRGEINVINGLVYKGQKLIVPKKSRQHILEKIHYGHLGRNKCTAKARVSFFWPSMSKQIEDLVTSCYLCRTYQKTQIHEPMISHEIPDIPFNKVAADVYHLFNESYLLVIDYYSKYVDVTNLNGDLSSQNVINKLKACFSRFGIPRVFMSDGGGEFSSYEFSKFSNEWEFQHIKSTPRYPQSNGAVERAIQTTKSILRKCILDKKDPYLALLDLRISPIDGTHSPANILMCRNLRSLLPQTNKNLKSKLYNSAQYNNFLKISQEKQKHYYDRQGTRNLRKLDRDERVMVQIMPRGMWQEGEVKKVLNDRAYQVDVNGKCYIRNRRFIKPYKDFKSKKHSNNQSHTNNFSNNNNNNTVFGQNLSEYCFLNLNNTSTLQNNQDLDHSNVVTIENNENNSDSVKANSSSSSSDESFENCLDYKNVVKNYDQFEFEFQSSNSSYSNSTDPSIVNENYVNRYGRSIKKPSKFDD